MMRHAVLVASLLACACGPSGTVGVKANLLWEPDAVDFGDRPVLDELDKPVRLLNVGAAPLAISAMRIDGDDAFKLVEAPLDELPGGSERDVLVRFVATEMKDYAATLIIESDDEENPLVEIALTGRGSTAAQAIIDPESLDFGRVGQGRSSVRRVRITSTGTAELKIRTIAFAEGSSAAYGFVGSTRTPQSLDAHVDGQEDAFAEITVKFAPTGDVDDTEGVLVLETTAPDKARVEIPLTASVNLQPVAEPGDDRAVIPGVPVDLDGSASHDPDGDEPLTWTWTIVQQPAGSAATLSGADTATPSFVPDQPGMYAVDLVVTDAAGLSSAPARVQINGATSEKLEVSLVWDHPSADLDLHMMPEGEGLNSPLDCYGYQPNPDWGVPGFPDDDPAHLGDRLSGFGPERVVYEQPVDGRYALAVKYVSPQGSAQTSMRATLRVLMYGVIIVNTTRTLETPGEVWDVGTIEWPSGRFIPFGGTP